MRDRKKRRLSAAEKRAITPAGLIVTRDDAGGERAVVTQLKPESDERRRSFAGGLAITPVGLVED